MVLSPRTDDLPDFLGDSPLVAGLLCKISQRRSSEELSQFNLICIICQEINLMETWNHWMWTFLDGVISLRRRTRTVFYYSRTLKKLLIIDKMLKDKITSSNVLITEGIFHLYISFYLLFTTTVYNIMPQNSDHKEVCLCLALIHYVPIWKKSSAFSHWCRVLWVVIRLIKHAVVLMDHNDIHFLFRLLIFHSAQREHSTDYTFLHFQSST